MASGALASLDDLVERSSGVQRVVQGCVFTEGPIWMPDGAYTANTWLIDGWTPDGMLSANLTDSLTIRGNLWQDWHVAPKKP